MFFYAAKCTRAKYPFVQSQQFLRIRYLDMRVAMNGGTLNILRKQSAESAFQLFSAATKRAAFRMEIRIREGG